MARRRLLSLATLVVGLLAVGATAASAQAYPPGGPTINVVALDGSSANVNGSGWQPGALITVQVNPVLGTVTAGADGTFSQTFEIPCSIGNGDHTITASGIAADGVERSASTGITLSGCPGAAAATTSGPLAFTGTNSIPWAAAGGIALGLGAVLSVIAFRRYGARGGLQA